MCGIAGLWNLSGKKAPFEELQKMISIQQHRGPEGAAYTAMANSSVLLGFLKLGFTDNQLGMQPLFNEDGSIALVYNGEIYDYQHIRNDLIAKGHKFYTYSDSEVLIHLYEEYGMDFLHQLNGEFAFALYDDRQKKMIVARDPFGINPLTYAFHNGHFCFSSEAKGVLVLKDFQRKLSSTYLSSVAIGIPNTQLTIFEGIQNLRPGHCMVITTEGIQEHYQYWAPSFEKTKDDFDTVQQKTRTHIRNAVQRRLEGKPPIALSLSSGIDSTIIAGISKSLGYQLPVFSLGYSGRSYDESAMAELSAKHYEIPFHRVEVSTEEIIANYRHSLFHTESTTNSLSNAARFLMDGSIRSAGLKAIIGGEASDEVFGGYPYFILEGLWRMQLAGDPNAHTLFKQFKTNEKKSHRIFWDIPKGWDSLPSPYNSPVLAYIRAQKAHGLARLWNKDIRKTANKSPEQLFLEEVPPANMKQRSGFDTTRIVARSVISTFGFPGLGDRIEMGNSLEGRVPFLDKQVVEYAYTLPEKYCLNLKNIQGKYILRETFKDILPPQFHSPPKHTFMSPTFAEAFKTKIGRDIYATYLSNATIKNTGLINPWALRISKTLWKLTPRSWQNYLFIDSLQGLLLSVQLLHDIFVANNPFDSAHGKLINLTEHHAKQKRVIVGKSK
ncbi:MAG: asparagine synthase (glutamine-hydrolyzing) [Aureispira sp.]|nr:asparagine synthase (glutamine-hydrolyzing) [Aureispira sp.]